jgi:hypothetical protein
MRNNRPASKAFLAALAKSRGTKSSRPAAKKPPFSVASALADADRILALPPARAHIVRQPTAGKLVRRFALPLRLCKPQNKKAFAEGWQFAATRKELLGLLAAQLGNRLPKAPLPGRPIVQCIRFSSKAPDAGADSFKQAIDCLSPRRFRKVKGVPRLIPGVGLIADDDPDSCDVRQRWEHAPSGKGFCVIEVWSGEAKGGNQ